MQRSARVVLRGFTFIELMVVMAIIGILSVVVLGSLVIGRYKAQDAAIKSDLHIVQSQMEIYFDNNKSYGTAVSQATAQANPPVFTGSGNAFTSDATINGAMRHAIGQSGGNAFWSVGPSGATYAIAIKLKADSTHWWCVDSTNKPILELDSGSGGTFNGASSAIGGGAAIAACP